MVNDHEGEWTAANQENYQAKVAAVENIDKHIERTQKALDVSASNDERIQTRADDENISHDEAHHRDASHQTAVMAFCRGGMNALTDEERESLRARVNNPSNALSTGEGSERGYLTRREFESAMTEAMSAYGSMRDVANVIQTDTGTAMDFPITDSTSEEGEILAESLDAGDGEPSFGTKELLTYKYSSKVVAVPFELLQDARFRLRRISMSCFLCVSVASQNGITGTVQGLVNRAGFWWRRLLARSPAQRRALRMKTCWTWSTASTRFIDAVRDTCFMTRFSVNYED